ncbi:MAG TPA: right-handed parallel beta-helix repeat-containing protein [Thermoanaerobaculia bacterium]|nr:right-handed parallel beta-helix repeat-containing protein [Thermoanaerobaculia bacterium]
MILVRGLTALVVVSLSSAPLLAQSIPNWTAPRSWTPPAAAAMERKVKESRAIGTLGIDALPTGPLPLFGIAPCRIVDTRGNGFTGAYGPPALSQGSPRNFILTGRCGIPGAAQAVSLNVTVTNTQGPGFILIYPQGGAQPNVSTLNYVAGQTIANAAVVPLSAGGGITVIAGVSGTDLIIDTNGYYAPASGAASKTVAVDCTAGQSIQAAIDREDGPLVVDVDGFCNENVSVKRKDVTLRGTNPLNDGIQGVVSAPQFAALRFAYTDAGRVENLSILNGPSLGIAAFFSRLTMVNSRVTGNGGVGMTVSDGGIVDATGLTASQNAGAGAHVSKGAAFFCHECNFENNGGFAAIAANGGVLSLLDSVVTGQRGLRSNGASYADIDCITETSSHSCSLNATGRAAQAFSGGIAALYGAGNFTGQVEAGDGATVQLVGARQLATGQPGQGPIANLVGDFGTLSAGTDDVSQSQLFGTTNVSGFGRLLLRDMTTLSGSIQCNSAGDAWLDPTIVKGPGAAISGCEHGVLPP